MSLKPRDIEKVLKTKLAFVKAKNRSDDHRCYELQLPGLPLIHTKVSHTKAEIRKGLAGMIARQLRLRMPFFDALIKCKKTRQEYEEQVRRDPYPPFDVIL